jgi:hypothetical protein
MQALRDRQQFLGPVHRELFLTQLLSSTHILYPGEAVVLPEIG